MKRILRQIAAAIPTLLRDAAGLGGAGLCSYGAWLIYQPAGFIAGGVLLLWVCCCDCSANCILLLLHLLIN